MKEIQQTIAPNRSPPNRTTTGKTSGKIPLAKEAFQIQHQPVKVNVKSTEKKPVKPS
jgi:hypothetical protein